MWDTVCYMVQVGAVNKLSDNGIAHGVICPGSVAIGFCARNCLPGISDDAIARGIGIVSGIVFIYDHLLTVSVAHE